MIFNNRYIEDSLDKAIYFIKFLHLTLNRYNCQHFIEWCSWINLFCPTGIWYTKKKTIFLLIIATNLPFLCGYPHRNCRYVAMINKKMIWYENKCALLFSVHLTKMSNYSPNQHNDSTCYMPILRWDLLWYGAGHLSFLPVAQLCM